MLTVTEALVIATFLAIITGALGGLLGRRILPGAREVVTVWAAVGIGAAAGLLLGAAGAFLGFLGVVLITVIAQVALAVVAVWLLSRRRSASGETRQPSP